MSSKKVRPMLSARCLQLLAMTALTDRRQLVPIAYALKNDARMSAVRLAQRWVRLSPAELQTVAREILGGGKGE